MSRKSSTRHAVKTIRMTTATDWKTAMDIATAAKNHQKEKNRLHCHFPFAKSTEQKATTERFPVKTIRKGHIDDISNVIAMDVIVINIIIIHNDNIINMKTNMNYYFRGGCLVRMQRGKLL